MTSPDRLHDHARRSRHAADEVLPVIQAALVGLAAGFAAKPPLLDVKAGLQAIVHPGWSEFNDSAVLVEMDGPDGRCYALWLDTGSDEAALDGDVESSLDWWQVDIERPPMGYGRTETLLRTTDRDEAIAGFLRFIAQDVADEVLEPLLGVVHQGAAPIIDADPNNNILPSDSAYALARRIAAAIRAQLVGSRRRYTLSPYRVASECLLSVDFADEHDNNFSIDLLPCTHPDLYGRIGTRGVEVSVKDMVDALLFAQMVITDLADTLPPNGNLGTVMWMHGPMSGKINNRQRKDGSQGPESPASGKVENERTGS